MEDFLSCGPFSERLLVIGVDGVIGANLALALADRMTVLGLYQRQAVELDGCQTLPWKPREPAGLEAAMRQHRPHWVVYCGPTACASWDIPDEALATDVEAKAVSRVAGVCRQAGTALTFVSSDAVFSGPRLFHDENDPATNPRPFARAVRQVEKAMRAADALMVRTHAYGWGPAESDIGFAHRLWRSMTEGASCVVDPCSHATPILATDLAELLWLAYRRGLRGLLHVGGAERTSVYRFAEELAAVFNLSNRPTSSVASQPDHAQETSLNSRLASRQLGRPLPMLRDGLERFADQAGNGFRSRFRIPGPSAMHHGDAA